MRDWPYITPHVPFWAKRAGALTGSPQDIYIWQERDNSLKQNKPSITKRTETGFWVTTAKTVLTASPTAISLLSGLNSLALFIGKRLISFIITPLILLCPLSHQVVHPLVTPGTDSITSWSLSVIRTTSQYSKQSSFKLTPIRLNSKNVTYGAHCDEWKGIWDG